MRLHVELFLWLVQGVDALFKELVLHTVVLLLRIGNFLGWLVVTELASLGKHGNVSNGVNLLQAHLELVEEAQGQTTLTLHDLVNHLRVELDVQVAQRRL